MKNVLLFSIAFSFYSASALDFLTFALQHPPGYCRSTFKDRCLPRNMRDHFTIHGLWPSSATPGDKSLENCPIYDTFNVKDLTPIKSRLDEVWPSAKTNNPVQFWQHEWKRHGTCGLSIPALTGVFRYFNTTLALYDRFNLMEFLRNDDIVPSTRIPYSIADIQYALGNDLRSKVNLVCDQADGFKHPILTEVRICLNEEFQPMNCPGKKERCGKNQLFFLPLHGDGRLPGQTNDAQSGIRSSYGFATSFVLLSITSALVALHIVKSRNVL